jgi:hypothetical protein
VAIAPPNNPVSNTAPSTAVLGITYKRVGTNVSMPIARARPGSAGYPNCTRVEVTMGKGTSLVTPSNNRNSTTIALRMRPLQTMVEVEVGIVRVRELVDSIVVFPKKKDSDWLMEHTVNIDSAAF